MCGGSVLWCACIGPLVRACVCVCVLGVEFGFPSAVSLKALAHQLGAVPCQVDRRYLEFLLTGELGFFSSSLSSVARLCVTHA
jgi:hypothetical protein